MNTHTHTHPHTHIHTHTYTHTYMYIVYNQGYLGLLENFAITHITITKRDLEVDLSNVCPL